MNIKRNFDPHVSCRFGRVTANQHIFKSGLTQNLCETVPFSLTLQPCSPEYLTLVKTDSKKNVSFECFEVVGSLQEKGSFD